MRELRGVERAAGLYLVSGWEEDLLSGQLVLDHVGHEVALVKKEARGSRENKDKHRLKGDDPPPNCLVHVVSSWKPPLFEGFYLSLEGSAISEARCATCGACRVARHP